eukprot:snap_masked-scaffold_57-processed-gene-0.45-mRNA-1 protein AED:1.00 eAED:1.00 QI:0/-1/0/0/-1/1/1/0/210
MSAQDHSDMGEQEAPGISPSVRQSIERSYRRIRQEVRSEMQEEIQRLGTQMTDGLAEMGEQLMQRMRDQIQEVLTPAVAQGGSQGQVRSAEGGSITEKIPPVGSREPGRLLEPELKLKGYPVLESLNPAAVSKFLLPFQIYEELVRERINKPEAYLQRCISIEVLADLKLQEGIDTNDRESILEKLYEIQQEDQSNRKARLLYTARTKLK